MIGWGGIWKWLFNKKFMQTKKAFTFVEIIIVISIIALLAVVWLSYQWAFDQKAQNTKVIWDVATINNSILAYLEEKKDLPDPQWNKNYFGTWSEYSHDVSTAFWVHGFVTETLLPKKYLNYLPLDPRTNQYYAYWKTIDNKFYEVAWVLNIEWVYTAKVMWNYSWEIWPYSLIREYNWPNFVSNNSTFSFPYNPEERLLVAKIDNFSWTVTINWKDNSYSISDSDQVLDHTLVEWDTITVLAWGLATIFYSDWSQSFLWDSSSESKLTLANMQFVEDDNLITRIQVALNSWTLWTKATNLNPDKSNFEVYTQDTSASVRWTIFWVKANSSTSTTITVIKWEVEAKKISQDYRDNFIEKIKNSLLKLESISNWTISTWETYNGSELTPPTEEPFSANTNFEIENISIIDNNINITIPIKNIKNINKVAIVKDNNIYLSEINTSQEALTLTWSSQFSKISNWTETKKQRNALYLKDVKLDSNTALSNIISSDSEYKIYLCNLSNEILKCSWKQSFENKENSLIYEKADENLNKTILNCKFKDDFKCLDNDEIDWMKLFAYAPYDSSTKMFYKDSDELKALTQTQSGFTIIKWWYLDASGVGWYLKYEWLNLLDNDFAIEMSVKLDNTKNWWIFYLLDNGIKNLLTG